MMSILKFSLTVDSGGLLRVCAFWLSWSPDLFLILLKLWKCVCLAALISCSLFGLRLPLLELSVPFFGLKKLRGKSRSTNRRDWAVFEGFFRTSKRSSRGFRSSNLQLKKLSTYSQATVVISKNICGTDCCKSPFKMLLSKSCKNSENIKKNSFYNNNLWWIKTYRFGNFREKFSG